MKDDSLVTPEELLSKLFSQLLPYMVAAKDSNWIIYHNVKKNQYIKLMYQN